MFINTFSAHSALGPSLAYGQAWPWSKLVLQCFIPCAVQSCLGAEAEQGFALGAGPCSQRGWELLCSPKRQELPPSELFLEVALSFHTDPVLGLAVSGTGDASQIRLIFLQGWAFGWGRGPTALGGGTDPSRAPAALPGAGGAVLMLFGCRIIRTGIWLCPWDENPWLSITNLFTQTLLSLAWRMWELWSRRIYSLKLLNSSLCTHENNQGISSHLAVVAKAD